MFAVVVHSDGYLVHFFESVFREPFAYSLEELQLDLIPVGLKIRNSS